MTTPQTPAGWYADPDGSGGQRYWDGNAWTEHRAPAPQPPPPPPPPPPPAPEPPSTAVRGGAHRAPEPEDTHTDTAMRPTIPVQLPTTPVEALDVPAPAEPTAADATAVISTSTQPTMSAPTSPLDPAPSDATAVIPTFAAASSPPPSSPPPSSPPPSFPLPADPPPSGAGGTDRSLLTRYLAVCGALAAVLVAVGVYGIFFADDGSTINVSSDDLTTSATASPTTEPTGGNGWGDTPTDTTTAETTTETPPTETGDPTDGALAFSVGAIELGDTVVSSDAPVEKTAVGQYVVVHLTVTNISDAPTTFLGTFQKLKAGGAVYSIDDEATFYTGGGMVELNPGDTAEVAVAFDVPAGTTPEAIELHTDPISPGVEIPLA